MALSSANSSSQNASVQVEITTCKLGKDVWFYAAIGLTFLLAIPAIFSNVLLAYLLRKIRTILVDNLYLLLLNLQLGLVVWASQKLLKMTVVLVIATQDSCDLSYKTPNLCFLIEIPEMLSGFTVINSLVILSFERLYTFKLFKQQAEPGSRFAVVTIGLQYLVACIIIVASYTQLRDAESIAFCDYTQMFDVSTVSEIFIAVYLGLEIPGMAAFVVVAHKTRNELTRYAEHGSTLSFAQRVSLHQILKSTIMLAPTAWIHSIGNAFRMPLYALYGVISGSVSPVWSIVFYCYLDCFCLVGILLHPILCIARNADLKSKYNSWLKRRFKSLRRNSRAAVAVQPQVVEADIRMVELMNVWNKKYQGQKR